MEAPRTPATFQFEEPPHVMVIETRYYPQVADLLLAGTKAVLDKVKATYEVIQVPGALEIPAAITYAIKSLDFDPMRRRYEGFVTLGCILKGSTNHNEIIAYETVRSLQELVIRRSLAMGVGILTCDTMQQAVERADPKRLDRGGAAAEACLRMLELKHKFRLSPKRRWVAKQ